MRLQLRAQTDEQLQEAAFFWTQDRELDADDDATTRELQPSPDERRDRGPDLVADDGPDLEVDQPCESFDQGDAEEGEGRALGGDVDDATFTPLVIAVEAKAGSPVGAMSRRPASFC
jgi:hypothetical protein